MSKSRNEEQEEAIRADLKRGEEFCLCPECNAARKRIKAAGFRACLVVFDMPGSTNPAVGVGTVARDDDEAKERAEKFLRLSFPHGLAIPLSVRWLK